MLMNESGSRWCLMAGDWHLRCGFTMSVSTSWNARTGIDFCGFLVGSSNWIL